MRKKCLKKIGLAVLASAIITVYTHLSVVYASDLDIDSFTDEMGDISHISNDLLIEFENWYHANSNKEDIDLDGIASTAREMSEYIDENNIKSMDDKKANEILVYAKRICDYAKCNISLSEDGTVKIGNDENVIYHTKDELEKSLFEEDNKKALSNIIKNTSRDDFVITVVGYTTVVLLAVIFCFAVYRYIGKVKNKQVGGGL